MNLLKSCLFKQGLKDVRISKSFFEDCRSSLEHYCPTVTHVEGSPSVSKVAAVMCLSRRLLEEKLDMIAGKFSLNGIPSNCARHLQFELLARSESLALDPILARACEADRKRFCAGVPEGFGQVIYSIYIYQYCLMTTITTTAQSYEDDDKDS